MEANNTLKIAERMTNAWNDFIEVIESRGFTHDEAVKAANTMLNLRVAKMDAVMGRINVTHGAYLDVDAIKAAVEYVAKSTAGKLAKAVR